MERVIDGRRFKVWALPHPLLVHWLLNPGLVVNELLFGQRIPRETLIEQDVPGDLTTRQHVVCPSCDALTSWAVYKAAGLQFGLYRGIPCRACGGEVPQLLNVFSWLLLLPLRFLPGGAGRRHATLDRQAERLRRVAIKGAPDPAEATPVAWKEGLGFGAMMAVLFALRNMDSGARGVVVGLVTGAVAGLVFGGVMQLIQRRTRT